MWMQWPSARTEGTELGRKRSILSFWSEPRTKTLRERTNAHWCPPRHASDAARFMSVVLSAGTMALYDVDVAVTQRLREVTSKLFARLWRPWTAHDIITWQGLTFCTLVGVIRMSVSGRPKVSKPRKPTVTRRAQNIRKDQALPREKSGYADTKFQRYKLETFGVNLCSPIGWIRSCASPCGSVAHRLSAVSEFVHSRSSRCEKKS